MAKGAVNFSPVIWRRMLSAVDFGGVFIDIVEFGDMVEVWSSWRWFPAMTLLEAFFRKSHMCLQDSFSLNLCPPN